MDKFEKITSLYILGPVATLFLFAIAGYLIQPSLGIAYMEWFPAQAWIFLGIHLIYLHFVLKDITQKGLTKLWLLLVLFTADIGAIIYSVRRRRI